MKELISPANLITILGAVLTVIGCSSYLTGAANLSLPTLFYGFPIFLIGLALKTTEIKPAKSVVPKSLFKEQREQAPTELNKLLNDVTKWKYGQHAHLESSLQALDLWEQSNPPQLLEIEELSTASGYGIRLRFEMAGVSFDRWEEKKERLGRFFAKGLQAELLSQENNQIDLVIKPPQK